jgi:hypothetical protein
MNHLDVDVEADIQAVIAGERSGHPYGGLDLVGRCPARTASCRLRR